MKTKLGLWSIFSLILLMIIPVHADVTSLSLEKSFYTIDENFKIIGTQDGREIVYVIIRDQTGDYRGMLSDPTTTDGEFDVIPRAVSLFFDNEGIYNATAFTDSQREVNGTSILLEFDGKKVFEVPSVVLQLKGISDKIVEVEKTITFTASLTDDSIKDAIFSLDNEPAGATIDPKTGKFVWTPSKSHGNIQDVHYNFDIIVKKGSQEDRENITITVKQAYVEPEPKEIVCPQGFEPVNGKCPDKPVVDSNELKVASFVDETKDPQSYVDRYNNEASYKKWFDENYSQYSSIYEAVGLDEPLLIPAAFVDETKDPQSYVDRYNNEASYKKWFDENYSQYSSIYEAVGLDEPKTLAPFVDPNLDPQYYVDRYNKETTYKKWFDENYPKMTIYEAVGLDEPEIKEPDFGQCGEGTRLIGNVCTIFDEIEYGQCGEGTELIGKVCEIIGKTKVKEKPWWQFW
ncbi:putative Ig domain-containing protein [Candidatus Nitrosopumilus sediminis]|uniref:Ig family protein n=1 Tax=Candidatus Nitrosopumilus sediminis TaxID=1229909 RepID=K0B961_9ARCH|nr:putative Ig domain-containing protein [Candidatus Nitrosopumilus sediminis]AFS82009.1 Ig family protein [Candidatus Nitrosopumilus sediminis]